MILGLGTDLCQIERIERAIQRPRFLERVYTPSERERILTAVPARRPEIAAGLFAAKEAVSKALGTGFAGFGPAEIEVLPDSAGCPRCALSGGALHRAATLNPLWRVHVSITHEAGLAAATAILEAPDGP